jgi:hypothetical protein
MDPIYKKEIVFKCWDKNGRYTLIPFQYSSYQELYERKEQLLKEYKEIDYLDY